MAKWTNIFNGAYQVTRSGVIRNRITKKILVPFVNGKGYLRVTIYRGISRNKFVHQIVAQAFLGKRPVGHQINHIDGNKKHNCAKNLEYLSMMEHVRHSMILKRSRKLSAARPATSPDLSGRGLF